jgi:galacturan 1,4-alpha-galacturonidase
LSGDLQGGGGAGRVNNITYDTFLIDNVDYAIEVDQCYGQSNITLCNEFPSPLTITNILFTNFIGTTSKMYLPEIGAFACSSPAVCNGITASSINVMSPNGSKLAYCQNVNAATLDVTCSTVLEGFN